MKKKQIIEATRSKSLLMEGSFEKLESLLQTKLKSGKGTLDETELKQMSDNLYDAIHYSTAGTGLGTDEDAIKAAFTKCVNFHDVRKLFDAYAEYNDADLLKELDGDIDGDKSWHRYVLSPITNAYIESRSKGHFKDIAQQKINPVEEKVIKALPCLKETPGYEFWKENVAKSVLYFKADGGSSYAVKPDGTLWLFNISKNTWDKFPEKTKCSGAKYTPLNESKPDNIEEQGINLNPGGNGTNTGGTNTGGTNTGGTNTGGTNTGGTNTGGTNTGGTNTGGTNTGGTNTGGAKPKIRTKLMTGTDVEKIQQILVQKGINIGNTGPSKNGVDGKLGTKTLAGIKQFMLGATKTTPKPTPTATATTTNESLETFKRLIK